MASIHRRKRSQYWWAYWRDAHGHPHCRSTKITTRKEARKVAELWELTAKRKRSARHMREVFSQIYRDTYGQDIPSVTVRQYCERWLDEKRLETSPASLCSYSASVNHFLAFLGERASSDIALVSRADIVAWRSELASHLYRVTVNRHIKTLRSLFKSARRDGYVVDNPLEGVSGIAASQADLEAGRRPFTLPEIQAVLEVADPEWHSLIKFGFYTGQRLTDLALLRWDNMDLTRGEIRFVTRKTHRRVAVPICEPLREHIISLPTPEAPDAPVHPRSSELVTRQGYSSSLSQQFAALLVQTGLRNDTTTHRSRGIGRSARRKREELSFHSLRHSATTMLHELGVPVSVAQALIGHESDAIHESYVGVGMDAMRQAAARLPVI
jgi:integrase